MKVWVVERVYEKADEVIAVFSSEELAKEFIKKLDPLKQKTYTISSWGVDDEMES